MEVLSVCISIHTYFYYDDDDDDYEESTTREVSDKKLMNGTRLE